MLVVRLYPIGPHTTVVLTSWNWAETTVDVLQVEIRSEKGRDCAARVIEASKFLVQKGYQIAKGRFTGDLIAVRAECIRPDYNTSGLGDQKPRRRLKKKRRGVELACSAAELSRF